MNIIIEECLLQQILDEKGWTQTMLADKTGVPKSQINSYITNRRKMSLSNAILISIVLNRPITSFYRYTIVK